MVSILNIGFRLKGRHCTAPALAGVRLYTGGMQNWDPSVINGSPLFETLRYHGAVWNATQWPELAELQAVVDARGVVSGSGCPLHLAPQDARTGAFEDRYEVRIYREGALQLRARNWHDLFNLLVWITFPRTKAAINARHYQALLERQSQDALNRGPAQDALTLFDESGVIVAASDADLLHDVRNFAWKRLFWQRRERVQRNLRCFIFGHALYEKALQPFEGITGRSVLFEVDHGFQAWPLARQLHVLDKRLAHLVADHASFQATRELAPLPLLGIPGWWPANKQESFYDNTAYFRPGRRTGTMGVKAT
ncbi:MAG: DUF3025 domain-containing protein [Burkholderiales bacterium]